MFKDIIGQDFITGKLINNINNKRIAHSQLFEGKNGYGVFPIAISYLKYLNCRYKTNNESCGVCVSCQKISKLEHPDIYFIFPVNRSKSAENLSKTDSPISDNFISKFREYALNREIPLYIDEKSWYDYIDLDNKNSQPIISKKEADFIIDKLIYKPIESEYLTFVIWMPERLNESAANTLLKQFEEPLGNALFIFLSEDSSKIIKTIISRTQITSIPPINQNSITDFLKVNYTDIPDSDINVISKLSHGDILKAITLSNKENLDLKNFDLFKELMRACYQNNHIRLLEWVDDFSELQREEMKIFFIESLELFRSAYMQSISLTELNECYGVKKDFMDKFYPYINSENISSLIDRFEEAFFEISRNGNIKIIMTHFVLTITKLIKH